MVPPQEQLWLLVTHLYQVWYLGAGPVPTCAPSFLESQYVAWMKLVVKALPERGVKVRGFLNSPPSSVLLLFLAALSPLDGVWFLVLYS